MASCYIWEDKDADTQSKEFKRWKDNAGVKVDLSAAEMLKHLRNRFKIEDSMPDETARRIISIRLDIYMNRYRPNPIRVAMDVNQKTIARLRHTAVSFRDCRYRLRQGVIIPWRCTPILSDM